MDHQAVVAGIALVAAGAAFASTAKKAGGGSGSKGSSGYSHAYGAAGVDPSFVQGGAAGGGIIGKIRGNDWVLMSQVAADRRNGQTGSFSFS